MRLSAAIWIQPQIPLAGLVPAIHALLTVRTAFEDVGCRIESGHGDYWLWWSAAVLLCSGGEKWNRTAVGLTWPSTRSSPRTEPGSQAWVAGTSLAMGTKGCANAPRNPEWPQGRAIAGGIVEILAGLPAGQEVATGGPLFIDRAAGAD